MTARTTKQLRGKNRKKVETTKTKSIPGIYTKMAPVFIYNSDEKAHQMCDRKNEQTRVRKQRVLYPGTY